MKEVVNGSKLLDSETNEAVYVKPGSVLLAPEEFEELRNFTLKVVGEDTSDSNTNFESESSSNSLSKGVVAHE